MADYRVLRINSFVSAQGSVVIDLFGEDAAQLNQQLGLEHAVRVDLAFHLENKLSENQKRH